MLGPEEILLRVGASADEIAQGLARLVGHPDCGEVAAAEQPGELGRVTAVGLDPIAGLGRDERGGDDDALDPKRGELALEGVAGRPGFIGDREAGIRHPEPVDELSDGRRIVRDLAVILGLAEWPGHRDRDRCLVNVKPDKPRTLTHWTGLPYVALRGQRSTPRAIHDDARAPVLPC